MKIVIWTDAPDRAGHIIKVANIDTTDFEKNPVLLHDHERYGKLPVGRVVNLSKSNGQFTGEVEWDEADERAKEIKGKYERGFMKAFSMGVRASGRMPVDGHDNHTEFLKASLLEISTTVIPSHPDSLIMKKSLELSEGEELLVKSFNVPAQEHKEEPKEPKSKPMKELFKSLGLAEAEANEASAINAVADLKKRLSIVEAADTAKAQEITDLQKKLKDAEDAATAKEIDALVDGAVSAKKITATQAPEYKELCKSEGGMERVKKILDAIEPAKSISNELALKGGTELNKKLAEREGWDLDKWAKEDPEALTLMKSENPAKLEELKKAVK